MNTWANENTRNYPVPATQATTGYVTTSVSPAPLAGVPSALAGIDVMV